VTRNSAEASPLWFLVGDWTGTGTWGVRPVELAVRGQCVLGRFIQLDVTTSSGGFVVRKERIVFFGDLPDPSGAVVFQQDGTVQWFHRATDGPGGAFVFDCEMDAGRRLRWTIKQDSPDAYGDWLEIAEAGGELQPSVVAQYARAEHTSA